MIVKVEIMKRKTTTKKRRVKAKLTTTMRGKGMHIMEAKMRTRTWMKMTKKMLRRKSTIIIGKDGFQ
jgi:hypothetical protein